MSIQSIFTKKDAFWTNFFDALKFEITYISNITVLHAGRECDTCPQSQSISFRESDL